MASREEEFLKRLLATFRVEAEEHVSAISSGLIELERSPPEERRREIVEGVFREAHSLKGAARSVNLTDVELVCQSMESLFAALKREEVPLSPGVLDLLFRGVDAVSLLLEGGGGQTPEDRAALFGLRERLSAAGRGEGIQEPAARDGRGPSAREKRETAPPVPEGIAAPEAHAPPMREAKTAPGKALSPPPGIPASHGMETIRIPRHKLDSLLLQAEELIGVKLIARQHLSDFREIRAEMDRLAEEWDRIHPILRKAVPMNCGAGEGRGGNGGPPSPLRGFLESHQEASRAISGRLSAMKKTFEDDSRIIGTMVDSLLEDMKDVLMFPCSTLLDIFPKIVRDLSKEQGKEIDFRVSGGEIEIDNRILQELKDPLVHMIRNCVDHGIETPEKRARGRKAARGKLAIAVSRTDSGKVEILVTDDGGGIDPEKVKASAVSKGIITPEEASRMGGEEAISLIFRSGFSTAPAITTLSGRGLGLAIVREKIEKLGGTVEVETHNDSGTTFRVLLPLTMATFRGTLVRAGERIFAIPTMNVERVVSVRRECVKTVENVETIELSGNAASLVRLGAVLELDPDGRQEDAKDLHVMVLGSGGSRIAFQVDEVLNEEEIIVKSFGRQLSRVRNIAGATVLGTGKVVLVLNVSDLLKSAVKSAGKVALVSAAPEKRGRKRKTILVVEDSITARTLLKNILESVGYDVVTAVDGVDGFITLRSRPFDLVVSDVQMPRMDGLELTEKIRGMKEFPDLPVILVTGLESPEDKRKGVAAGANAYLVKSSFDQTDLLSAIRRMI